MRAAKTAAPTGPVRTNPRIPPVTAAAFSIFSLSTGTILVLGAGEEEDGIVSEVSENRGPLRNLNVALCLGDANLCRIR